MVRFGSVLSVLMLAATGVAAQPASVSDAAFRLSAPSLHRTGNGTAVSGFVCRAFNLSAPVPSRIDIQWRAADGHVLARQDAAVLGGPLEARGARCGHYAVAADWKPAAQDSVCVTATHADGHVLAMRAVCTRA